MSAASPSSAAPSVPPTSGIGPLLEVRGLEKRFRARERLLGGRAREEVHALRGVDLDLARGEALGIVGESGCGKSTLARILVGLERADAGSVRLDGLELTALSARGWKRLRRRIQIVFQDASGSLDPRQSVQSALVEPLAVHRLLRPRERGVRALALLDAVGLGPEHLKRFPHELSGGQRQRVAVARALALEPEILVCDEPVSALDLSVRAQVLNLLGELKRHFSLSLVFIAHDLLAVRSLCERTAVLYLGRVVEEGPTEALFSAPEHPYTQALLSAAPLADPEREVARQRIALAGEPPSALEPPSGCSFHPRCFARERVPGERCVQETPELLARGAGSLRRCACHLYGAPSAPETAR